MNRPPLVFALWGAWLGGLGVAAVAVFGVPDPETPALLGGAAAVMVTLAVALLATGLGRREPPGDRALPDLSPPTVWLALALALLALGAQVGMWLVLVGAGGCVIGLGALARERLAQRRALDPGESG